VTFGGRFPRSSVASPMFRYMQGRGASCPCEVQLCRNDRVITPRCAVPCCAGSVSQQREPHGAGAAAAPGAATAAGVAGMVYIWGRLSQRTAGTVPEGAAVQGCCTGVWLSNELPAGMWQCCCAIAQDGVLVDSVWGEWCSLGLQRLQPHPIPLMGSSQWAPWGGTTGVNASRAT